MRLKNFQMNCGKTIVHSFKKSLHTQITKRFKSCLIRGPIIYSLEEEQQTVITTKTQYQIHINKTTAKSK